MLLHRAGADLQLRDMTGSSVAHMAASSNSVLSLRAIFDCFGDPGVLSVHANNGATPAHVAAAFDNAEVNPLKFTAGGGDERHRTSNDHPTPFILPFSA